ncbi:rhamnogalacturonan acetylesterase [Luteolibacter marinus]|uniref:rhamnogalacturonan acetylesterase n=1 Tax=Luteolibacter marinus TaxID=2776705 RepID=UPI001D02B9C4|nr:rhamnogalacturonan acetylesterase [Luteolibacter marinus]
MGAIFRLLAACLLAGQLFAGDERPVVDDSMEAKEQPSALPSVWIAGDSTVKNRGEMRGWGQDLGDYLDPRKVQVVNRAIGGRSSRTFLTDGRWDEILGDIKRGDLVLIQFGHNDVGPLDERGKFRGSVKGIGDEIESVAKPDGSVETVHSYGWYLKHFARTAKSKGAVVVLCSPVPHKKFDRQGRPLRDWDTWRGWVEACARAEGVSFIDLAEIIGRKYDDMETAEIEALFADKGTHTNAAGARLNACAVIAGLKGLPGAPVDGWLSAAGREIETSRP